VRLIVGARLLVAARTVIVNAGSEALAEPSLTLITMLVKVPTLLGVPESRPVVVLNTAQLGLFWMENESVLPSASAAFGWKKYATPTIAPVGRMPLIVGAAANALSGASSTATNEIAERAKANARTRANARAFFDDMGMQIPIDGPITRHRIRHRSHPHTEFRTA
jgi:hypothetical protein